MITVSNVSLSFGGQLLFKDVDLKFTNGNCYGIIGANGAGKSTFLKILCGEIEPTTGEVVISKEDRLSVLRQDHFAFDEYTVLETVIMGNKRLYEIMKEKDELYAKEDFTEEDGDRAGQLESEFAELNGWEAESDASKLIQGLGLSEDILYSQMSTLSGNEKVKVLLAQALFGNPDIIMLDEPTNHLDEAGRTLIARYHRGLDRGFLLVSHDRAFLDACTDHTLALHRTGPELVQGNFSVWYQEKERRDQRETARNEALRGEIRRLEQASRRTSLWSDRVEQSKYGSRNSGLRPDRGYLGHKSAKLMQRAKNLETRQQRAIQEKTALLQDVERADSLKLCPLRHHSQRLLEGRDLVVLHDGRPANFPVRFTQEHGQRLCLSGGNGSGKTSLLRLVLGEEPEHIGSLWRASGLTISYVPQRADRLCGFPAALAEEQGLDRTQFFTVLRKLDFSRLMLERDMTEYSAGQQKKLLLAASLCQSAHLYVWDEPLNYIDLFSRIQLVEHDRTFCRRVGTDFLLLDAE